MPTVDLITYCYPSDIHCLYKGWKAFRNSHKYPFHEVILIRQRCRGINAGEIDPSVRILESEDYPDIFAQFNIDADDPVASAVSNPGSRYYWKYHCMNQLIGLSASSADYIAFTDCDNLLEREREGNPWVKRGLDILQNQHDVLMVCPSHGGPGGDERTKVISQCMFLCERQRFLDLDYNVPVPDGVQWGEFHFEFEGRIWRYAQRHPVYRVMLGKPPIIIHQAWL